MYTLIDITKTKTIKLLSCKSCGQLPTMAVTGTVTCKPCGITFEVVYLETKNWKRLKNTIERWNKVMADGRPSGA